MKRKMITLGILLVAFGVTAFLNGCTRNTPAQAAATEEQSASEASASLIEKYVSTIAFPAEYSITYEIINTDGTIVKITKAKDSAGNIYYQFGQESSLFVLDNGHYKCYGQKEDGKFTLSADGNSYTAQYVEELTKEFTVLAEKSREQNMPTTNAIPDTEILGRPCSTFETKVGFASFSKTYLLWVDQETGICMGWNESTNIGNNSATADNAVFTCIDFQTDNIALPQYE